MDPNDSSYKYDWSWQSHPIKSRPSTTLIIQSTTGDGCLLLLNCISQIYFSEIIDLAEQKWDRSTMRSISISRSHRQLWVWTILHRQHAPICASLNSFNNIVEYIGKLLPSQGWPCPRESTVKMCTNGNHLFLLFSKQTLPPN